jgi:predicted small lipoprotein YifL
VQPRHRRAFLRIVATLGTLVAAGQLAACGFKGPLYMPGSPQDTRRHREPPPPAIKPGGSVPETTTETTTTETKSGTSSGGTTTGTPAERPDRVPNLFR